MRTISIISIATLLLGVVGSTAAAQEPHKVYDQDRGELSIGTQIPTRDELMNVIRSGAPTALMAMLEYGERLECYECVPLLQKRILESDDARVREFSAWWLRRRTFAIGGVMTFMVDTLNNDSDPTRRARAAEAIGEFLSPVGLEPLTDAAMNDAATPVREAAVRGLGRLNHPDGNGVLAEAMADPDAKVRRAALSQVLKVNFFREHGAILDALGDEDPVVRRKAAKLAGEFELTDAVPALTGMLRGDDSRDVRQAAAWALGRIGGTEAFEALAQAQESESNKLVLDAIEVARAMR
ncbi:MAG: HEAT repeat domain-containing protein [Polyangiales bacterium]